MSPLEKKFPPFVKHNVAGSQWLNFGGTCRSRMIHQHLWGHTNQTVPTNFTSSQLSNETIALGDPVFNLPWFYWTLSLPPSRAHCFHCCLLPFLSNHPWSSTWPGFLQVLGQPTKPSGCSNSSFMAFLKQTLKISPWVSCSVQTTPIGAVQTLCLLLNLCEHQKLRPKWFHIIH